jgi:hypothetical protein
MVRAILALSLLLAACGAGAEKAQPPARPAARPSPAPSRVEDAAPRQSQEAKEARPAEVDRCLADAANDADARTDKKLDYLKGDFDGDGLPDYALAVRGHKTRRNGVLVCPAHGERVVLGADNPTDPPFSDMPHDNFVAPKWEVYTKEQAAELSDPDREPPARIASPRGDSIAMIWEDGICLIYWDGARFKWACGQ